MPTRLCLTPRCPEPATYRGRCATHARRNEHHTHNPDNKRIYNTKRWQTLRRKVLTEQPICAHCNNALSAHVDHIMALEDGGAPYSRRNVQGLCVSCHSVKTQQEQATR